MEADVEYGSRHQIDIYICIYVYIYTYIDTNNMV